MAVRTCGYHSCRLFFFMATSTESERKKSHLQVYRHVGSMTRITTDRNKSAIPSHLVEMRIFLNSYPSTKLVNIYEICQGKNSITTKLVSKTLCVKTHRSSHSTSLNPTKALSTHPTSIQKFVLAYNTEGDYYSQYNQLSGRSAGSSSILTYPPHLSHLVYTQKYVPLPRHSLLLQPRI